MAEENSAKMSATVPGKFKLILRVLRCMAAFFAAYIIACLLLDRIAPFSTVPTTGEKWAYLQEHRDDLDAIFIGSSRVFHGISVKKFDELMAAGGKPMRSFNFGNNAMWPPESFYLLRQIANTPLRRIKWVFIEMMELRPDMKGFEMNDRSAQMTYWHDVQHTWLSISDLHAGSLPWLTKWSLILKHVKLWIMKESHLGSGTTLMERRLWPRYRASSKPPWFDTMGFSAYKQEEMSPEEFARWSSIRPNIDNMRQVQMRPRLREELSDIIARIRAAGAEPVFFISPTVNAGENFASAPDGAALLKFNQPAIYPKLHDPSFYCDVSHLNHAGALIYTEAFAQKFLEHLKDRATAERR